MDLKAWTVIMDQLAVRDPEEAPDLREIQATKVPQVLRVSRDLLEVPVQRVLKELPGRLETSDSQEYRDYLALPVR